MRDGMAKVLVVLRWVQCGEWAPSRQGAAAWSSTVGNAILGSLIWWEGGLGGGGRKTPCNANCAVVPRFCGSEKCPGAEGGARGRKMAAGAKWRGAAGRRTPRG